VRILVVNAGSSSLKLSVLDDEDRLIGSKTTSGDVTTSDAPREPPNDTAFSEEVAALGPVDAVGHRIVHGGAEFLEAVLVDDRVRRRLEALTELAPLHQPKSLAALDAVSRTLPDVPAVACFDTAFHARMPPASSTYALPSEWRERWALKRYGFHGLAHAYDSRRAAQLVGREIATLRIVTCHLGSGASLAAVEGGVSVDTTMGFTPLEGLVMATRSGSVDPGLVLWLEDHVGTPPSELASTLERRSGLLGLTGSSDMRSILEAEEGGDPDAVLGVSVYLHRLRSGVGAMAAAMNGLDSLVFSGGVGENAASIRARAVDGLGFLGAEIDPAVNKIAKSDLEIGTPTSRVKCLVVEAREDLEIARQVREVLG
jgi:acetate kinase